MNPVMFALGDNNHCQYCWQRVELTDIVYIIVTMTLADCDVGDTSVVHCGVANLSMIIL